jgi:hypothetical protein
MKCPDVISREMHQLMGLWQTIVKSDLTAMQCFRCPAQAILYQRYSGRSFCARHLCADIESRAKRVVRQNRWLAGGDRIGVVCGMTHSDALGIFLGRLIAGRSDITLIPLAAPSEPVAGSFAWYRGLSEIGSCARCSRIALPWCADDLAEEILSCLLRGDVSSLLRSGIPEMDIPVMHPLQEIPADELLIYKQYMADAGSDSGPGREQEATGVSRPDLSSLLAGFSSRHPSAPHALRRYRDQLRDLAKD